MLHGRFARVMLVFSGFLVFASAPAVADQGSRPAAKALDSQKSGKKSGKVSVRVRGEMRYEDNIFLLSDGQKKTLMEQGIVLCENIRSEKAKLYSLGFDERLIAETEAESAVLCPA